MEGEKDKITKVCSNCGKCSCPALEEEVNKSIAEIAEDLNGGQKKVEPAYNPHDIRAAVESGDSNQIGIAAALMG